MVFSLDLLVYVLAAVLLGAVVFIVWVLTKEKREYPLQNETDLGIVVLALPDGIEEGRLTTARKTFERHFESLISNCEDDTERERLQASRDTVLGYNLYAFKGDNTYFLYSNANILDEKYTSPMGKDKDTRFINVGSFSDEGEFDGFQTVFLKMPTEATKITPEERKRHSLAGKTIKFVKSAAMNVEKITQIKEERDFFEDENKIVNTEKNKLISLVSKLERALSQQPLGSRDQPKLKGGLTSRLAEFFYSGWRVVFSGGGALLTYAVARNAKLPFDPIYAAIIVALVVFWLYPTVAERV